MGSDNGKVSHRPPRNKERQKLPLPLLDSLSNGSHSTGDASADRWRNGSRSSRGSPNARDNASVTSSQSSVLVKSDLYKEMPNRHERRGKSPEKPSTSHGLMRVCFLVVVVMIIWVLFNIRKAFPDLISGSLTSPKISGDGEREVGVSNTKGEQINVEEEKSNSVIRDEYPDVQLASLASGAGSNLWESVLQTTNGGPDPGADSTVAVDSLTSTEVSSEKDHGFATFVTSSSMGMFTSEGRIIDGTTYHSSASETNTHIDSAADGLSQVKDKHLRSDGTTPSGQLLANGQRSENEDQLESNSGVQKGMQTDKTGRSIFLAMADDERENSQQHLSQGLEAHSMMQVGMTNESEKVLSSNSVTDQGEAIGGLREQETMQTGNLEDGPDLRPQDLDNPQKSSIKQGMLRGSNTLQQIGADQTHAADGLPTSLRGSMMQNYSKQGYVSDERVQTNQDETQVNSNGRKHETGGTFNQEMALSTDPLAQQESVMSNDVAVHNAGGDAKFHEANGVHMSGGLMAQQFLQHREGIMSNAESLGNVGGNGMTHESNSVQMRAGSVSQKQQNGSIMSNDGSLEKGGDGGKSLENYGSLQNGTGNGNFQEDSNIQIEQVSPQEDNGMESKDMSVQNDEGYEMVRTKNDMSTGEGSQQLVQQQNDSYTSIDMSIPHLNTNYTTGEKSMGQQQNEVVMSSNIRLPNGEGNGNYHHNNDMQVGDNSVTYPQQVPQQQNEGSMSHGGSLQNGESDGRFQGNSSIQMETADGSNALLHQMLQQEDDGVMSHDKSAPRGGGNDKVRASNDMTGEGSMALHLVQEQNDSYAPQDMSIPNLDTNDITRENSMGQQQNDGVMSSNIRLPNGEGNGNFDHNNDMQVGDGSVMQQQDQAQQLQNEGSMSYGGSLQNGAGSGNFQENSSIQMENGEGSNALQQHVLQQQDDVMVSHDLSAQIGGGNHIGQENYVMSTGEGSMAQHLVQVQNDSYAPQDMSIPHLNTKPENGAGSGNLHENSSIQMENGEGSNALQQHVLQQQDDVMVSHDMSAQVDGGDHIGQENYVMSTGEGSMAQHLVQVQNDRYAPQDMSVPHLDTNYTTGEKSMGQQQNEGVMSSNIRLPNGEGNGNFHHNNNMQVDDGSVMQQQDQVHQQQNEGSMFYGGSLQNGAGSGNFQENSSIQMENGEGSNALQQQILQQQDDGVMSHDKSVQTGGGNGVVQENSGMGDGSIAIEQQEKRGMLTDDRSPQRNAIETIEQLKGDHKVVDMTKLRKQNDPSANQKVMVVSTNLLDQNGRSTSGGVINVLNKPSRVGSSNAMVTNDPVSGIAAQQQGDGSVSTSLNIGMSNLMQSQTTGNEELSAQLDLAQQQMLFAQGHRHLDQATEPESAYENMSPTELAKYVANHAQYRKLMNFDEGLPFDPSSQVPFLFHIHKSAGSSMKHMLTCMGLTQTRRGSSEECDDKATSIRVCPLSWGSAVNADASSPEGIERIKKLGLLELNVPNLVVTTSRFYEALSIFTPQHRGRLFVILRDPIERAISKYYYTRVAKWERNYNPAISNMTMLEYAHSHHCYDNWVTRRLIHKMNPVIPVTDGDLRLAKEILRQKALILLTGNLEQSSYRMVQFFNWTMNGTHRWCATKYSNSEIINKNPHPIPSRDSPEWAAFRGKNLVDIELYRYALSLYHDQQGPYLYEKFGPLNLPDAINPEWDQNTTPDEEDLQ